MEKEMHKLTLEQQKAQLTANHEQYVTEHQNVFQEEYMTGYGNSSVVKTLHLKKPGERKGFFSKTYAALTKSTKQDDIAAINQQKVAAHKGLHDVDGEGNFTNYSDLEQQKFFLELKDMCKELCNLEFATGEFIQVIATVDDYITAENYSDQQTALIKTLAALKAYTEKTANSDNEYELVLCSKTDALHRMLEGKSNGTLVIPEKYQKEAAKVHRSPKAGALGTYVSVKDLKLFPHDPSPNDVKQRTTSDCYMMSSLCSIAASRPDLIKKRMRDNGDTVTVQFFDTKNQKQEDGTFKEVTEPVFITVNKKIPTYLYTAQKNAVDSLWVQMIEKAFAVYYGNKAIRDVNKDTSANPNTRSYEALDYQNSFAFLSRFLGPEYSSADVIPLITLPNLVSEQDIMDTEEEGYKGIPVHNETMSDKYSGVASRLHKQWEERLDSAEVITVGILGATKEKEQAAKDKGFHTNHAYTVLKVFEVPTEEGKTRKFVRLRDPYGAFTSDYDQKTGKTVSSGNSYQPLDSTSTMGTFDVEWNEFLNTFDRYTGCIPAKIKGLVSKATLDKQEEKQQAIYANSTSELNIDDALNDLDF